MRLSRVPDNRKDGSKGKLRIDYGDPHQPADAVKWLWKFIDGAKTAGELYGRALVVIARRAVRLAAGRPAEPAVAPDAAGARTRTTPPRRSRSSPARTCRRRCKELEQAITRAHREHDTAVQPVQTQSASHAADAEDVESQADADPGAGVQKESGEFDVDEDLEGGIG